MIEWDEKIGIPAVEFLTATGFDDFEAKDKSGRQALDVIASCGARGLFAKLISMGGRADMKKLVCEGRSTTLFASASYGSDLQIMETVLQHNPGIDINFQDLVTGQTALHAAFSGPNRGLESIRLLLELGADLNIKDRVGCSPIFSAVSSSSQQNCFRHTVDLLLQHNGNLHTNDALGNTLLHHAVKYGNLSAMEVLLEKGCDVNARTAHGASPLHFVGAVARFGYPYRTTQEPLISQMVRLLLVWGADPSVTSCFLNNSYYGCFSCLKLVTIDPGKRHSAVHMTPVSLVGLCRNRAVSAIVVHALHSQWPEVTVDMDGDVFWNARGYVDGPSDGCEYLVVTPEDEALGDDELLHRIWVVHNHRLE